MRVAPAASMHSSRGDQARDRQDWLTAAEHYKQALTLRPEWASVRVQLGNMLKEAGQWSEAEEAYRRALDHNPNNADIYLQLGHLLKLQMRRDEAMEAYFKAAACDPALEPARVELRNMGVSQRTVEQHIAANSATSASSSPVLQLDRIQPLPVRGWIHEIGLHHVAGMLQGIGAHDAPLTLVCRAGARQIAMSVIGVAGDTAFPTDTPFRLEWDADISSDEILTLRIEPQGQDLIGSPFMRPGKESGSVWARLNRLEEQVGRQGAPVDLAEQLLPHLVAQVLAHASERVEALLRQQRISFEAQALNTGSAQRAPSGVANPPRMIRLPARDGFDGLGWSKPELSHNGVSVRFVRQAASVGLPLMMQSGAVVRIAIPGLLNASILNSVTITSASRHVPFWIVPDRAKGDYQLYAVIPANEDDFVQLHIALAHSGGHNLPVASIDISALEAAQPAHATGWCLDGWDAQPTSVLLVANQGRVIWGSACALPKAIRLEGVSNLEGLECFVNGHQSAFAVSDDDLVIELEDSLHETGQPLILGLRQSSDGERLSFCSARMIFRDN